MLDEQNGTVRFVYDWFSLFPLFLCIRLKYPRAILPWEIQQHVDYKYSVRRGLSIDQISRVQTADRLCISGSQ